MNMADICASPGDTCWEIGVFMSGYQSHPPYNDTIHGGCVHVGLPKSIHPTITLFTCMWMQASGHPIMEPWSTRYFMLSPQCQVSSSLGHILRQSAKMESMQQGRALQPLWTSWSDKFPYEAAPANQNIALDPCVDVPWNQAHLAGLI
jgi:hypothetical protein